MIEEVKAKCESILNKCKKELDAYEYLDGLSELEQTFVGDLIVEVEIIIAEINNTFLNTKEDYEERKDKKTQEL